jgi:hypothetical protein
MSSSSAGEIRSNREHGAIIRRLRADLRERGLWPVPEQAYQRVEGQVAHALPAVAAPPRFRESLASNLDLLAQHRNSGVEIKREPQRRAEAIVGLSVSSLVLIAGLVVLIVLLARAGTRRPAAQGTQ